MNRRTFHAARAASRGWTLHELMISVGIIGMIALMTGPLETLLLHRLRTIGAQVNSALVLRLASARLSADARASRSVEAESLTNAPSRAGRRESAALRSGPVPRSDHRLTLRMPDGAVVVWTSGARGVERTGRTGRGAELPRRVFPGIVKLLPATAPSNLLEVDLVSREGETSRVTACLRNARVSSD